MAWLCTLCQRYIAGCYGNVLQHVKCHQYDENFQLKCGINSCQETYTIYESFRSHVYRKHREVLHPSGSVNNNETLSVDNISNSETDDDDINNVPDYNNDPDDVSSDSSDNDDQMEHSAQNKPDLKSSAARLILKLHQECKVTQSALNSMVNGIKELWKEATQELQV